MPVLALGCPASGTGRRCREAAPAVGASQREDRGFASGGGKEAVSASGHGISGDAVSYNEGAASEVPLKGGEGWVVHCLSLTFVFPIDFHCFYLLCRTKVQLHVDT